MSFMNNGWWDLVWNKKSKYIFTSCPFDGELQTAARRTLESFFFTSESVMCTWCWHWYKDWQISFLPDIYNFITCDLQSGKSSRPQPRQRPQPRPQSRLQQIPISRQSRLQQQLIPMDRPQTQMTLAQFSVLEKLLAITHPSVVLQQTFACKFYSPHINWPAGDNLSDSPMGNPHPPSVKIYVIPVSQPQPWTWFCVNRCFGNGSGTSCDCPSGQQFCDTNNYGLCFPRFIPKKSSTMTPYSQQWCNRLQWSSQRDC